MKEEVSKYANKFKCVQTKLFQINKSLQGLSTFVPIQFDREYTSMAVATLHSSVIDFKFSTHAAQSNRIKLHDSDDEAQESSHTFMENGILVEKKLNLDHQNTQTTDDSSAAASGTNSSSKNSSPAGKRKKGMRRQWHPHNIAEYFFFNDNGQLEVSEDTIR